MCGKKKRPRLPFFFLKASVIIFAPRVGNPSPGRPAKSFHSCCKLNRIYGTSGWWRRPSGVALSDVIIISEHVQRNAPKSNLHYINVFLIGFTEGRIQRISIFGIFSTSNPKTKSDENYSRWNIQVRPALKAVSGPDKTFRYINKNPISMKLRFVQSVLFFFFFFYRSNNFVKSRSSI